MRNIFRKPGLFEEVDESFWRDPYISQQILDTHLDPATDDASRKPVTVNRSSEWIAGLVASRSRLLDLGCGPGLYCEAFYRHGLRVTGVDYSPTAIDYATRRAAELRHRIDYRLADYRFSELPAPFEIITLIYGGFCCIADRERDDLLARVRRSLLPGGLFVFDVFTSAYIDHAPGGWYLRLHNGFWRRCPHLVFERKHDYPGADTHLDRYIVIDAVHGGKVFNLWKHFYSRQTLEPVLRKAGLEPVGWYADLTGVPFHPAGRWIGVVARSTEA